METILNNMLLHSYLATLFLSAPIALAQESDDSTIEEIVVTGDFTTRSGQSALKSDIPLSDVPMTVSAYTRDFMDAIETNSVADLYNYMAGVRKGGATGYDISIRGFSSNANDRNVIQTDGLPGLAVRFGSPPTVNAERIEVVKGPTSVLYGQIQPGGFINIITKKPENTQRTEVRVRTDGYFGSDARLNDTFGANVSVDSTGPVDSEGNFLYRLVAQYGDGDTFRDHGFAETIFITPSITWSISDATDATIFAVYRKEDYALDNFLVAFDNVIDNAADLTTRYQEPDDEYSEVGYVGGLRLEHAFTNNLEWNLNYRYVWHEDTAVGYENLGFRDSTTLTRRDRNQENVRKYNFADTNLVLGTTTGSIGHKLLVGFNGGREYSHFTRLNFDNDNPTLDIDIYDPVYGQGIPRADRNVSDNDRERYYESWGVYVSDLVTLTDEWKVLAGIRYEVFDTSEDLYQPVAPTRTFSRTAEANGNDISSMVGLIYQPDDVWSVYASYAESFDPPSWGREDVNGNQITDPEKGMQIEVGAKAAFAWANATLSLFSIERSDVAQDTGQDALDGDAIWRLSGVEKSEGLEVLLNANVTDAWQLIFAYSYVDAYVDSDIRPEFLGQQLLNAPMNTASIWSRYQYSDNWGIGLGVNYTDDRYGSAFATDGIQASRLRLPAYTLVDLGIYYTTQNFGATLKFGNLFDETYYVSATRNTNIVPGNPANVNLAFTARF